MIGNAPREMQNASELTIESIENSDVDVSHINNNLGGDAAADASKNALEVLEAPPKDSKKPNYIVGPLTFKGTIDDNEKTPEKIDHSGIDDVNKSGMDEEASTSKKMQKRLKLKHLIVQKFKNKYGCSAEKDGELNNFIQSKMDDLFS